MAKYSAGGLVFLILLSHFGFGQTRESVVSLEVKLTGDEMPIDVDLKSGLPGTTSEIELILRNNANRKLNITQIRVSCGCLVVGKINSVLESGAVCVVPVKLKNDFSGAKATREIVLADSEMTEWKIYLNTEGVSPITCENKVFEFEKRSDRKEFKVKVFVEKEYLDCVEKLRCEATGITILEPKLEMVGGDFWLKFTGVAQQSGIRRDFTESVRIHSGTFSYDLVLQFRCNETIRAVPGQLSLNRISEGLEKVILFDADRDEGTSYVFVAKTHGGKDFEINMVEMSSNERLSIFSLSSDLSEVHDISGVDVFRRLSNKGKEHVYSFKVTK